MNANARHRKGFTLMEMLIVVAVIAILVAIAVPTLMKQLHKVEERADLANARAYYAYLQENYLATGEYLPQFDKKENMRNIYTTIKCPDGTSVKLKTGFICVSVPHVENQDKEFGYKVYYSCNKGDLEYVFGEQGYTLDSN